jgi:serine/threonine protein kinase
MDFVDQISAQYKPLSKLGLNPDERKLLKKITSEYANYHLYFFKINRGLSEEKKLVVKPSGLFPFLLKIGGKKSISDELDGYNLLKLRLPPLSIVPLERYEFYKNKGALLYRYVTGGLVKEPVNRMDVALSFSLYDKNYIDVYNALIKNLLDVVLKKCHWLDGNFEMRNIQFPKLPKPEVSIKNKNWLLISNNYKKYISKYRFIKAPFGIVHGDLHPKNVLISNQNAPILIDFSMAKSDSCIYIDYAKLEVSLQFQLKRELLHSISHILDRLYAFDGLILPRSHQALASYINTIRTTLWKICLSKTASLTNYDIEKGYKGFLLYYLIRFWSKIGNSQQARQIALEEIFSLFGNEFK